jgi:hypothetical protein
MAIPRNIILKGLIGAIILVLLAYGIPYFAPSVPMEVVNVILIVGFILLVWRLTISMKAGSERLRAKWKRRSNPS